MTGCEWCGKTFRVAATGRPKRFCGQTCRKASSRSPFPALMRDRQSWVRADGKRPVQVDGSPASSTDPNTWSSFAEVRRSNAGDGFGVMLGKGLACFDFDDASDEFVRAYMADKGLRVVFAERSVSGRGVHVFVEAPESRGWRRRNVEFYSRARFIRVTGERFVL